MSNKLMKITIFPVLLILTSLAVFSQPDLYVFSDSNPICNTNGMINFDIINGGDEVSISELNIIAKPINAEYTIKVIGKWTKDSKIIKSIRSDYEQYGTWGNTVHFESRDGILTETGQYNILLNYPVGNDKEKTTAFKVNCPNFLYACSYINISIDECYTKNDYFYMSFLGKGLKQNINLDPYKTLLYDIHGTSRVWAENSLPDGTIIKLIENETYQMKFPSENNIVNSIKIRTKVCDKEEYPSTSDSAWKCENIVESKSDTNNSKFDELAVENITQKIDISTKNSQVNNISKDVSIAINTNESNEFEGEPTSEIKPISISPFTIILVLSVLIGSILILVRLAKRKIS